MTEEEIIEDLKRKVLEKESHRTEDQIDKMIENAKEKRGNLGAIDLLKQLLRADYNMRNPQS